MRLTLDHHGGMNGSATGAAFSRRPALNRTSSLASLEGKGKALLTLPEEEESATDDDDKPADLR